MKHILEEADYIIETSKTIREASQHFHMSKSVLQRHMSQSLKSINYEKYLKVKKIFLAHNKIRHIKGGEATKRKYAKGSGKDKGNDFIFCR